MIIRLMLMMLMMMLILMLVLWIRVRWDFHDDEDADDHAHDAHIGIVAAKGDNVSNVGKKGHCSLWIRVRWDFHDDAAADDDADNNAADPICKKQLVMVTMLATMARQGIVHSGFE